MKDVKVVNSVKGTRRIKRLLCQAYTSDTKLNTLQRSAGIIWLQAGIREFYVITCTSQVGIGRTEFVTKVAVCTDAFTTESGESIYSSATVRLRYTFSQWAIICNAVR